MPYPFREILENQQFLIVCPKLCEELGLYGGTRNINVMEKTGPNSFRRVECKVQKDSFEEENINSNVMVDLLVTKEEYDVKHKLWEMSLQEDIPFEEILAAYEAGCEETGFDYFPDFDEED